jgi:hypothetical protein
MPSADGSTMKKKAWILSFQPGTPKSLVFFNKVPARCLYRNQISTGLDGRPTRFQHRAADRVDDCVEWIEVANLIVRYGFYCSKGFEQSLVLGW